MTSATIHYAETLGMIAFGKGRPPQPGGDRQLMDACAEVGNFSKDANTMMRAWLKGWHTANLMDAAA